MKTDRKLTRDEARAVALKMIEGDLTRRYNDVTIEQMLDENVVEKEHCWIFFRSRELMNSPRIDQGDMNWGAWCVGMDGFVSQVGDYRDDPVKQAEYEEILSQGFCKMRLNRERIAREGSPPVRAYEILPGTEGAEFFD
jgi:hypothetical protein